MKIRCKIDVCAPWVLTVGCSDHFGLEEQPPLFECPNGPHRRGFVAMSVPARSHLEWNHLPCRWMVWRKSWSDWKLGDWKTHLKENARFCVLAVGVRKHQWVLWIYVNKKMCIYTTSYSQYNYRHRAQNIKIETENHGVPKEFPPLALASVHTLNKFQTNIRNKGLKRRTYSRTRQWLVTHLATLGSC